MIQETAVGTRGKFQFSNAAAQRAEAELNLREARLLADKWVPKHLREREEEAPTTEAGACFRNVLRALKGQGK